MSRVTQDQNQWGAGDLNGSPSSDKTNGTHIKRYGPLGVAGVGGLVKGFGGVHEAVFEISGDEILTENGVPLAKALQVEIPGNAILRKVTVHVHKPQAIGSVLEVKMASQSAFNAPADDQEATVLSAPVPLDQWGANTAILIDNTTIPGIAQTWELGGTLYVDFSGAVADNAQPRGGLADVVIEYQAL